jgi:hypothetical protein
MYIIMLLSKKLTTQKGTHIKWQYVLRTYLNI